MHYHEEHPLEGELACSKYMTRTRLGPDAFTNPHQAFKVHPSLAALEDLKRYVPNFVRVLKGTIGLCRFYGSYLH